IVGKIYHPLTVVPSVASKRSDGVRRRPLRPTEAAMSTTRSRAVPLRAAVSSLAVPTVSGPVRRATVVASTRHGAYLLLDGGTEVLPLLTSDALALPTAVRLAVRSTGRSLGLDVGETVHVGR